VRVSYLKYVCLTPAPTWFKVIVMFDATPRTPIQYELH
jgi:hypothetical protein